MGGLQIEQTQNILQRRGAGEIAQTAAILDEAFAMQVQR